MTWRPHPHPQHVRPSPALFASIPTPRANPYPVARHFFTSGYQPVPYTHPNEQLVPRHSQSKMTPHQHIGDTFEPCTASLSDAQVHLLASYGKSAYQKLEDAHAQGGPHAYDAMTRYGISCSPLSRTLTQRPNTRFYHPALTPSFD